MPPISDIDLAVATLKAKQQPYTRLWQYYEGAHPLIYNRKRLNEVFKELDARFTENWCAVVVDSVCDRIELEQVIVNEDDAATATLQDILWRNELDLEADDAHKAAVVTGEGFIIAWPDEDGRAEAYYNDPRNVHLFYEAGNPRRPRYGCKWWIDDEGHRMLTLYYADRLEYYRSRKPVRDAAGFREVEDGRGLDEFAAPQPNPYGIVPVFHFKRDRRAILSEIANAIEPQDAINKLLADMMVAAEYGAFGQRWVISSSDTTNLKNGPNRIWSIPAGDGQGQSSSVGEFNATDLDNYMAAIDKLAAAIGIITRTPKHYFYAQGGDPSGEALIALEAPLNHKAESYIARWTPVWQRLATFLLRVEGVEVDGRAIYVQFDEPSTVQPLTQSIIRQNTVNAGVPLVTQLRDEGWTDEDLAQMDEDAQAQAAQQQTQLAAALVRAQRDFSQNGNQNGNGEA